MRRKAWSALLLTLVVGACSTADGPNAVSPTAAPAFARAVVDTFELPDLTVDGKSTQNNWLVRVEDFPADFCSVIEGGITHGTHSVIRFTVTTPNIGEGDVFVGSPLEHMDPNGDGNYDDQDGLFELASCHGHFHFQHYATYTLLDESGTEWKSAKRGFCMLDTDPWNVGKGDGTWKYRNCGTTTHDGFQGVSHGWADTYTFDLGGQYFVLDGGDGQPPVPPGRYQIVVEVNPPYAPTNGTCPRVTDPYGTCRQFAESDYTNNVSSTWVTITGHPGRTGYGTIKNAKTITAADEIER
jgi:hypothetical protein